MRQGGIITAVVLLAAVSGWPAAAQQNSGLVAELLSRLNAQEAAIRQLTADLEALEFRTRRQQRELEARIADLELRIVELEGGDPFAVTAAPEPAEPGAPAAPADPAAPAPAPDANTTLAPPPRPLGTLRVAEAQAEERQAFIEARRALREEGVAAGVEAFAAFERRYPNSPLRGESALLLGNAFFEQGRFTEAARQYLIGARDFPDSPLAPDSQLGLGQALLRMGRPGDACGAFLDIPRRFPAAEPGVLERARQAAVDAGCS
jgi:TolA-binding protein